MISFADSFHGGQSSFFLQVVKTPFEIWEMFFVEEIVFPYSLGSLLRFPNVFLLKFIFTSLPKN